MNRKPSLADINVNKLDAKEREEKEEINKIVEQYTDVLQLGFLHFKDSQSSAQEGKPFMRANHNIRIEECIHQVFDKYWKIKTPRIVVSIMSNVGPLKEWTNPRQIKQFQRGIIKAAQNTNMWLLCNGINMGSTSLIGDAVFNEITESKYKKNTEKDKFKLNVIGIAEENKLRYGSKIAEEKYKIEIANDGGSGDGKYELNSDLNRYIIINDKTPNEMGVNTFITNLVSFLSTNAEQIVSANENMENILQNPDELCSLTDVEIPVISIVIRGGIQCSQLVLQTIKNRIPVVIFRGSGGLADLLSYVESEISERCLNEWDKDFVDNYLKPELTIKIIQKFPKLKEDEKELNKFCKTILDCVRLSRKDGQIYLTVLNIHNTYSCNLENLTEYLLLALFKSHSSLTQTQKSGKGSKLDENKQNTQITKKDLNLCVDWNCPEVAKREVLAKDPTFALNLEKKLFEESMTRTNRIEFVDLFLSQKFKLRSFVSTKRLKRMYRKLHSRDFFQNICWEAILGRTSDMKQSKRFLERELNWLIEACTGLRSFIDEEELNSSIMGNYPASEKEAERKSLAVIVMWALFDFRKKLVKVLWKHSDQPIHLAIVIAMVYDRLSWYVSEQELNNELKLESQHFITHAYNALDSVYKDSSDLAEQVLNESSKDWNFKSAVDLAAIAKFRTFLTHPCCQKWLTNTFNGNISVRDLRIGFFRLPVFLKILLSAYLLFPMYFWIRFRHDSKKVAQEEEVIDDDEEIHSDINKHKNVNKTVAKSGANESTLESSIEINKEQKRMNEDEPKKTKSLLLTGQPIGEGFLLIGNQPRVWTMTYELWNAPITKFWNHQLFYIFYLSLFSVAVLFPRCGNIYLDFFVCSWTVLIVADLIRQTYLYHIKYTNQSISSKIIGIVFQTTVLVVYISGRILNNQTFPFVTPFGEKVILCLALLYAFWVLITVFLPISATLGPLLYRLKIMLLVDFINFIRLSILVMVCFGVVIQAVLYPDMIIDRNTFLKTFHRALISLFISPIDELFTDKNCDQYLRSSDNNTDTDICSASDYTSENCRNPGFWPYFFTILYFILLKLILTTLLYAIFASSASSLTADTDSIWKYQRYILVMDFVNRLPLPPPLNLFYYIYYAIQWIYRLIKCYKVKDIKKFDLKSLTLRPEPKSETKLLADEDYTYLKSIAIEIYSEQENKISEQSISRLQWERIQANSEEIEYEKKILKQLKGKMAEMERSVRQSIIILETIKQQHKE